MLSRTLKFAAVSAGILAAAALAAAPTGAPVAAPMAPPLSVRCWVESMPAHPASSNAGRTSERSRKDRIFPSQRA